MKASLVETFILAKFEVEIQKYDFAGKVGCYRKNLLKILYLAKNKPMGRILLGFLSTLWALPMSNVWAQTVCISWLGFLVNRDASVQSDWGSVGLEPCRDWVRMTSISLMVVEKVSQYIVNF
jgi:hypothetical protein